MGLFGPPVDVPPHVDDLTQGSEEGSDGFVGGCAGRHAEAFHGQVCGHESFRRAVLWGSDCLADNSAG